jgi:hypothetical protein
MLTASLQGVRKENRGKIKPSLSCIERSADTQCFDACSLCWCLPFHVQGLEGGGVVEDGSGGSEGLCGASSQGIRDSATEKHGA